MPSYIQSLQHAFTTHQNPTKAAWTEAYMRGQFKYVGLEAKLWRQLVKAHIKSHPLPSHTELPIIVKELWQLPEREYQYAAVQVMAACKKQWQPNIIQLIEYCIQEKSWWDSVDHVASELTGTYFKLFPKQTISITGKWNKSTNIWLQRSSIMFQKFYKTATDTELLSSYIRHLAHSNEFFVQKAIGWALREYGKTNPAWVRQFVANTPLAKLSQREALKRIP